MNAAQFRLTTGVVAILTTAVVAAIAGHYEGENVEHTPDELNRQSTAIIFGAVTSLQTMGAVASIFLTPESMATMRGRLATMAIQIIPTFLILQTLQTFIPPIISPMQFLMNAAIVLPFFTVVLFMRNLAGWAFDQFVTDANFDRLFGWAGLTKQEVNNIVSSAFEVLAILGMAYLITAIAKALHNDELDFRATGHGFSTAMIAATPYRMIFDRLTQAAERRWYLEDAASAGSESGEATAGLDGASGLAESSRPLLTDAASAAGGDLLAAGATAPTLPVTPGGAGEAESGASGMPAVTSTTSSTAVFSITHGDGSKPLAPLPRPRGRTSKMCVML